MDLLDFIEAEAKANIAFHIANADGLSKESNTFLNLLLAAAGGLLTFFVSLMEKKGVAIWQLAAVGTGAIYFFVVAGLLLWHCLWVRKIWPPANEPKNFPLTGFDIDAIREGELVNRQACIEANVERNESVGLWLNRCRAMAAATPIATALVAWAVSMAV